MEKACSLYRDYVEATPLREQEKTQFLTKTMEWATLKRLRDWSTRLSTLTRRSSRCLIKSLPTSSQQRRPINPDLRCSQLTLTGFRNTTTPLHQPLSPKTPELKPQLMCWVLKLTNLVFELLNLFQIQIKYKVILFFKGSMNNWFKLKCLDRAQIKLEETLMSLIKPRQIQPSKSIKLSGNVFKILSDKR